MADILFINEEFFMKNIPHKQSFDKGHVLSAIRLVQKTNLTSLISLPVYDRLQLALSTNDTFSDGENKLFASIQLYLAVKVAEELIDTAPREEGMKADASHLSYSNKSTLMEARIVRDINRDSDLLQLAQSGLDTFDTEEMPQSGGFFFV